jgi:flagellar basal body-associated protein FliL
LCQETAIRNWTGCNHFADIARDKFRQVQKAEDLLLDITDKYSNKRPKRVVFNFIGEVSKIHFGTLDDDAKFYNEQIRHLEENSDSLTNLLKQQLIVVKSTLGTVNETLSDMEHNEVKARDGLNQIRKYIVSSV